MMIVSAPIVIGAMLLLLLPGVLWAWWRYPSPQPAVRIAVGLALSFAFQMHVSALLAWGPRITRASVLVATAVGIVLAGLLIWRMTPRARHLPSETARRHGIQLVVLLVIIALPRLAPLIFQSIPQGWDPSFHSLLASTTLTSGLLPGWSPFEQIPSNYPYGPHVFIAEISLITGVAPDRVFAVLLNAVLPTITCLSLYPLARRVLRSHAYALGAVAAYGLLGNWGSVDYFQWGGLPNELGFFLVLVFLVVLFTPALEWSGVLVGGVILGAIPIAHNHVMLTTVIMLVAYAAILLARLIVPWPLPVSISRRQIGVVMRRLILTALIALVTVSYYVVPVALRVGQLGSTTATQYLDNYSGVIFDKNGWLLWGLSAVGAAMMLRGLVLYWREAPKLRARFAAGGMTGAARAFVICASIALLLAFLVCYFGYRKYSFLFTPAHQPYTLFTPTRFLTDLTYFLPFFAALPLVTTWQWTTSHLPMLSLPPATVRLLSRVAVRIVITCIVLGTTYFLLDIPSIPGSGHLGPGEAAAYSWIRTNTPVSTLVLNLDTNVTDQTWTPYFTQREVSTTPVPVSEFTDGYVSEKRFLSARLLDAITLPAGSPVAAFAGMGTALAALQDHPVAILSDHDIPGLAVVPAFVAQPERVYLLGDAFSRFGVNAPSPSMATLDWWTGSAAPPSGWTSSLTAAGGWSSVPPSADTPRTAAYLRVILPQSSGPLSGMSISCTAHGRVAVFLDGVPTSHVCVSRWMTLPSLTTPGPHVFAFSVAFASASDPWFAVMLTRQATGV